MNISSERKAGIVFHTIPEVPWQYPVVTEKAAFESLYKDPGEFNAEYFAFPWATIIDRYPDEFPLHRARRKKKTALAVCKCALFDSFSYLLKKTGNTPIEIPPSKFSLQRLPILENKGMVFTVCQHISYRSLCHVMEEIGINVCFSSHATSEDVEYFKLFGIQLRPFPLFPVNVPEPDVNKDLLYSFVGMECRSDNLSNVRDSIYRMKHPADSYIKMRTGWHYDKRVYKEQVRNKLMTEQEHEAENNNTREFTRVLAKSRYSLCPSGTGPNNIRFWESLGAGSIPVLLSDQLLLPEYDWESCILRVPEKDLESLPQILRAITPEREAQMKENCLKAFKNFSGDNISSPIKKYLQNPRKQSNR
ncbi:glycosyltransferase family 47 protein [Gammaproteobacteria bacterium]|nr:glycosyltransferase family 47 protein [Gammaproteobacteria bacterium]